MPTRPGITVRPARSSTFAPAGGFVDAAEKIASEFVASGPIFWEAFADGTEIAHEAIVERALGALNPMGQDYRKLSRYFQGNSFDTELDASGRVILPAPLLDHTGIQKEVVVVGVGDHLEVWARERWQEQQDALDSEIGEVTERLGNPS